MAIRYTYECMECNQMWTEDLPLDQRNDPLSQACPFCDKGGRIKRAYTTSFLLKGDGWARDGYSGYLGDDPDFKAGRWNQNKIKN